MCLRYAGFFVGEPKEHIHIFVYMYTYTHTYICIYMHLWQVLEEKKKNNAMNFRIPFGKQSPLNFTVPTNRVEGRGQSFWED